MKRLLTLEDLYTYYSSNTRSSHFSAKDDGKMIVVQVPGKVSFESEDDPTEGLTKVQLQACHTDRNVNKTYISQESMEAALPSLANRPILGYIHQVDGQWEFKSHEMHMDEDGEVVYDEIAVGTIPETNNAHLEWDEEKEHNCVVVDGYIYDEYTKAKEILEREGECSVSVELAIRDLSFDAKEKILNIENFWFSGVTILGKKENGEDVKPGMEGSNIKLADFKAEKNSLFSREDVLDRLTELENKFAELSININEKGGEPMDNIQEIENFEQEVTEATEESTEETVVLNECNATEEFTEETSEPVEEKFVKSFELSHEDIRCALYALLEQYEEADNEWYYIRSVYEDYFVFSGFFENKIYGQKYVKEEDNVSFEGERWELFEELLTAEEKANLDAMRANYAELEEKAEKLAKYEAEPEKMNVLESEEYSLIANADEFVALKEQDAHFDLSVDEVRAKADEILMAYAKKHSFKSEDTSVGHVQFAVEPKKAGRYGNLFKR